MGVQIREPEHHLDLKDEPPTLKNVLIVPLKAVKSPSFTSSK
jgi:hypothetical protein